MRQHERTNRRAAVRGIAVVRASEGGQMKENRNSMRIQKKVAKFRKGVVVIIIKCGVERRKGPERMWRWRR